MGRGKTIAALLIVPAQLIAANFYVDPDYSGGGSDGSALKPWVSVPTIGNWTNINAALATNDATIYYSALKSNGTTQQSSAWSIQCYRWDSGTNRLTVDGYSFYNANASVPNWTANPNTSIASAFTNGQVFKTTGASSLGLGWGRTSGIDFVTNSSVVYCCLASHTSSSDTEPGVGADWQNVWGVVREPKAGYTLSSANWALGVPYKNLARQCYVTLRGFELTGSACRAGFAGSEVIYEYVNSHDVTTDGAAVTLAYTSAPDNASTIEIISKPSTNVMIRNFEIKRVYGEALYLGSINPDGDGQFQLTNGNQHCSVTIQDGIIDTPGNIGGQGDGIDCKHGILNLTIRRVKISGYNNSGIGLPQTAVYVPSQNVVVEQCLIHSGTGKAITAQTGGQQSTTMWGYSGVTIRNNVIYNCTQGITADAQTIYGDGAGRGSNIMVFNNTIFNIGASGLTMIYLTNSAATNNFVFGTVDPKGNISASGIASDYNAHDGTWTSANEGANTITLTTNQTIAAVVSTNTPDFHLVQGSALIGIGATISSFNADFDGNTRSIPWDIGAYEYIGITTNSLGTATMGKSSL